MLFFKISPLQPWCSGFKGTYKSLDSLTFSRIEFDCIDSALASHYASVFTIRFHSIFIFYFGMPNISDVVCKYLCNNLESYTVLLSSVHSFVAHYAECKDKERMKERFL